MKNLKNFNDFVNESIVNAKIDQLISEGALASKAFNMYDSVDIIMDEAEDDDVIAYHQKACDLLGDSPSNVCRLDSESDYDDAILQKAYDAMDSKFRGVPTDLGDLDLGSGCDLMLDSKLKVVRYDEYGFVAFFFTSDSKF